MLGSFSDKALLRYEELVRSEYKEKQVTHKGQGSEWSDTAGVGPVNNDFITEGESLNKSDYDGSKERLKKKLGDSVNHSEGEEWSEYDFTTCIRSNGTLYGIAPGKKCRKGSEAKGATKEAKQQARLKSKVLKAIEKDPKVEWARKEKDRRKVALKQREAFVKANRYPEANEGMQKEIARIKKEIADLTQDILREKRRIAKQVVESERKVPRAERLGRMAATKARAEKVLADIRKEKPVPPESDTARSARMGVFNKSQWD